MKAFFVMLKTALFFVGLTCALESGLHAACCAGSSDSITSVAGTGSFTYVGDGFPANSGGIGGIDDMALDTAGNIYIAQNVQNAVRKIDLAGIITTIAGANGLGYSGNGGPANAAQTRFPNGLAVDAAGNIYFSDGGNHVIRKVNSAGIISTYAGTGSAGYSGNGGPATSAKLDHPEAMAVDAAGNLYVWDSSFTIRKIDPFGIITHFAGTYNSPGYSGDGGLAAIAEIGKAESMVPDVSGNFYYYDDGNGIFRKIDPFGVITSLGFPIVPSRHVMGLSFCGSDFAFSDSTADQLHTMTLGGTIGSLAGTGFMSFGGDGGPASAAFFSDPRSIAFDGSGNLYVADTGNDRIRKISVSSTCVTTPTYTPAAAGTPSVTPTPSATPSATSTPSMTYTPSLTPSAASTPSMTHTPSATPAAAGTPSMTSTPSATPSPSPAPTSGLSAMNRLMLLHGLYPNPFSTQLHVYVSLNRPARLQMNFYNVAGEPICRREAELSAGKGEITWDGVNDVGARCGSGMYLLDVQAVAANGDRDSFQTMAAIVR